MSDNLELIEVDVFGTPMRMRVAPARRELFLRAATSLDEKMRQLQQSGGGAADWNRHLLQGALLLVVELLEKIESHENIDASPWASRVSDVVQRLSQICDAGYGAQDEGSGD